MPSLLIDKLRRLILDKIPPTLSERTLSGEGGPGSHALWVSPLHSVLRVNDPMQRGVVSQIRGLNMKYFFYKGKEESLYVEIYCINNSWTHIL